MVKSNGKIKVDIAVLAERINNHFENEEAQDTEMRSDIKEIKKMLEELRDNHSQTRSKIENHLQWHSERKEQSEMNVKKVGIIAALTSVFVTILFKIFEFIKN